MSPPYRWTLLTRFRTIWRTRSGSLTIGNPETVAKKILHLRDILGITRYMLHISVGTLPHDRVDNRGRRVPPPGNVREDLA